MVRLGRARTPERAIAMARKSRLVLVKLKPCRYRQGWIVWGVLR